MTKRSWKVIAILLWSLSLVTYTRLWLTPPGSPPMLTTNKTTMDDIKTTVRSSLCNINGEARVCTICKVSKPDRTHHCRHCNQCILKMDQYVRFLFPLWHYPIYLLHISIIIINNYLFSFFILYSHCPW